MRPILLTCVLALPACATLTSARPLAPGEHEVGASLGGGMLLLGTTPLPVPNLIVQGRSGVAAPLRRNLDVNYGLNLTALPFGILQTHVGVTWMLALPKGAVPAVSITERIWFATNAFGLPYKASERAQFWGADQIEIDVSWEIRQQLLYVGLAEYIDFRNPQLSLTPALGAVFDTDPERPGGVKLHLETRWFGVNRRDRISTVSWVGGGQGIFGVSLGVSYILGRRTP